MKWTKKVMIFYKNVRDFVFLTNSVQGKISFSVSIIVSLENAKKETRKSPLFDFNEVAWTKHNNNNYITLRSDFRLTLPVYSLRENIS